MDIAENLIAIWPKLLKYAQSLTRNRHTAEDLVMEVITKVLESKERLAHDTNIEAYAIRAVRNTFLNEEVKNKRVSSETNSDGDSLYDDTIDENSMKFTEEGDLERTLINLGSKCREILVLFGTGSSYRDIADLLELKMGTVMSRMARCRQSLSDQLEVI